jgi:hypothetical protein
VLSSSGSRFLDQCTEQSRDHPDLARRSRTQALARTNVRSIGLGRPLCSNPSVSEGSRSGHRRVGCTRRSLIGQKRKFETSNCLPGRCHSSQLPRCIASRAPPVHPPPAAALSTTRRPAQLESLRPLSKGIQRCASEPARILRCLRTGPITCGAIKKSAGSQFSGTSTVYAGETNALAGVAPGLPLTLQKEVV